MNKTLLLDLDNTLLTNEMNAFVPAYIQALARRMSPYVDPKILTKTLLDATGLMAQNQEPDLTLMDVFDAAFYPALNVKKADVQPALDDFYAEDFPKLRSLTSPRPEAIDLVNQALKLGYQIGVATNPLFPLTAIQQRLAWAGLPVDQTRFSLVPSYSSFHFAKPNPAYFAEFLAQMGWPAGAVVMVGDEVDLDMVGARQLGINLFWTPTQPDATWSGPDREPPKGTLSAVIPWLESASAEILEHHFKTSQAILAILRSTPAALQTMCRANQNIDWNTRPKANEWCLTEILCHLRDVETEIFVPRFKKIIGEENPFIVGIDSDPWAEDRHYILQDGQQALLDFIAQRKALLSLLSSLTPEDWQRPARHAIFGPTHLQELASFVTEHDRLHIQQVYHQLPRENAFHA